MGEGDTNMIPNEHAIMIYKFNENRWIEKILEGKLSFSCAGAFIAQAKHTGNIIQGDKFEGVFARQHKDNPKIVIMRKKLGKDLEEIPDGDYIFLRRSAKLKPIFCVFAYTANDAIKDGNPQTTGRQRVRLNFDRRLFDGFANESVKNVISTSHLFTVVLLQPKPFVDKMTAALIQKGVPFRAFS